MKNAGMLVVWVCLTFALGRTEGQTLTAAPETNSTGVSNSTESPRSSAPTATTAQPGSSTRVSDAGSSQNTATGTSPQQSSGSAPSSASTSAGPGSPSNTASISTTTTSKGQRVASFGVCGHILMSVVFLLYTAKASY